MNIIYDWIFVMLSSIFYDYDYVLWLYYDDYYDDIYDYDIFMNNFNDDWNMIFKIYNDYDLWLFFITIIQ